MRAVGEGDCQLGQTPRSLCDRSLVQPSPTKLVGCGCRLGSDGAWPNVT